MFFHTSFLCYEAKFKVIQLKFVQKFNDSNKFFKEFIEGEEQFGVSLILEGFMKSEDFSASNIELKYFIIY